MLQDREGGFADQFGTDGPRCLHSHVLVSRTGTTRSAFKKAARMSANVSRQWC